MSNVLHISLSKLQNNFKPTILILGKDKLYDGRVLKNITYEYF